jgi:tetratricopeptide (TPR) repeat protein
MQIQPILQHLDDLLRHCALAEAEAFLESQIEAAKRENDLSSALTLYNEKIGFLRDCGRFSESCSTGEEALRCIHALHLEQTQAHATTLLNVANAYRAAGKPDAAFQDYADTKAIYDRLLRPDDPLFASYFNNLSLLYQEVGDWENACKAQEAALRIVSKVQPESNRIAISHTNLAVSLLHLGKTEEAISLIQDALDFFAGQCPSDFHYSAALAAMGDALSQKNDDATAVRYYEAALSEIEMHMGKCASYDIVAENCNAAYERMGGKPVLSGMELSRRYYEAFGKPMLRRMFPEFLDVIATGLAGEGSECLNLDDALSRDHDFGPGFCLWLPDDVYDRIGPQLQQAYDTLPKTYMGLTRMVTKQGQNRVGVCRISDFYRRLIGIPHAPEHEMQWLQIDSEQLATAVSGAVFDDPCGQFTAIRRTLQKGYPKAVRLRFLAQETAWMAQRGQYNLPRLLQRNDAVTGMIAFSEFSKSAMRAAHLCNKRYAPYYKWLLRSTQQLPKLSQIVPLLQQSTELPMAQWESAIVTPVCHLIAEEMRSQGIAPEQEETYMQVYAEAAAQQAAQWEEKEALAEEIARLEFEAFDQVQNEGARAQCQDDWETFSIMRKSQYLTWTPEMLRQYLQEFQQATSRGWNRITEKYARMMQSTAPEQYAAFAQELPPVSEQKKALCEAIVSIQISWMEAFAAKYPALAKQARSIHTAEDTPWNTSYETYLRGELLTYSEELLQMYGAFVVALHRSGKNLAEMTMENTAELYGYRSLDDIPT